MEKEIWKDIPGYEGRYQASSLGKVKSLPRIINCNGFDKHLPEKLLKQSCKGGYFRVVLYNNDKGRMFLVHQLVAMAFLNHVPKGYDLVVDHINMNKLDNRVSNLRVITQRENVIAYQKVVKSSSKYIGVGWCRVTNKWRARIGLNGKNISLGCYDREIDAHNAYQIKLKEINNEKYN